MRAPIRSSDSAASALSTASGQPTDAHEDDADDGRVHAVTWLATSSARGPYAIACLRSPRVFSCSVSSSPKVASIVSRVRSRSVCSATQARRSASQVSLRRIPGAGRERSRPDRLRRTRAVEGAHARAGGAYRSSAIIVALRACCSADFSSSSSNCQAKTRGVSTGGRESGGGDGTPRGGGRHRAQAAPHGAVSSPEWVRCEAADQTDSGQEMRGRVT